MEKQALVPLSEYQELKEFYVELHQNGRICEILDCSSHYIRNTNITFIAKDDSERLFENVNKVIKKYESEISKMHGIIIDRNTEIKRLIDESIKENKDRINAETLKKQLEDIKKLSVWQFIKWRKTK